MPRYESLRNSRDFRRVLSDGNRRREGGIVIVSSPGPTPLPRLGLIVSKRCGDAVTRNRIKRRLRSAVSAIELNPGTDYVIIASSQVATAPFGQLESWVSRGVAEGSDA